MVVRNEERASEQGAGIVTGRLDRQTRGLQRRFEAVRNLDQDQTYQQGSFVIGGYTRPGGERKHMGALLVGVYEKGKLKFAGRVGTGFSEKLLKSLSAELDKFAVRACPFYNLPAIGRGLDRGLDPGLTAAEMKHSVWVKPAMVREVKFTEWTRDDRLRQPVFLGLREDKSACEVIRERAS